MASLVDQITDLYVRMAELERRNRNRHKGLDGRWRIPIKRVAGQRKGAGDRRKSTYQANVSLFPRFLDR